MTVRLTRAAVALATTLAFGALAAPAQAADPDATDSSAPRIPPGCTTWRDYAGPGGGERRHLKCAGTGLGVMVFIFCNTGYGSSPGYRYEYNKAECPGYGGRATGGWDYDTR